MFDELFDDFLDELGELVDRLHRGVAEMRCDGKVDEVSLVLHTIKGNALAFELIELSMVATNLLDELRVASKSGQKIWLLSEGARRVEHFRHSAESFLELDRESMLDAKEFFAQTSQPDEGKSSEPSNAVMNMGTVSTPKTESERMPTSIACDDIDVEVLLRDAPEIRPRIGDIIGLARRMLQQEQSGITGGFFPDHSFAASEGRSLLTSEDDNSLTGGPARDQQMAEAISLPSGQVEEGMGLAFEALQLRREIVDAEMSSPTASSNHDVCDYLDRLAEWFRTSSSVLVESFFAGQSKALQELRDKCGVLNACGANGAECWLPAVGDLVCSILLEAVSILLPSARPEELTLEVASAGGGRLQVSVRGLPQISSTAARLRMYDFQKRLEDLSILFKSRASKDEWTIVVPGDLLSMEVLFVASGSDLFAFPSHCVEAVREEAKNCRDVMIPAGRDGSLENLPVVDLNHEGCDSSCILVLKKQTTRRAIRVDSIVRREVVVFRCTSDDYRAGEVPGFCVDGTTWSAVPILAGDLI